MDAFAEGKALEPRSWLVTGAAGFIGSHLVERLLKLGQNVVGLDDFSSGTRENLEDVLARVGRQAARGWSLLEGDIREPALCQRACAQVDVVLHEAGRGSIPRSLADPLGTHQVNVDGTLNLLVAARDARVARFVFASSSSVYGDQPGAVRVEGQIGAPRSPYALSKRVDELYAQIFSSCYGLECVGLRYFNVFGPRQSPDGPYAAVIPLWIDALLDGRDCVIFGDGKTERDFCYVENVVQANLRAALAPSGTAAINEVYNVGTGASVTLEALYAQLCERLGLTAEPVRQPFRPGDARQSQADISKARALLGYRPTHSFSDGLGATVDWFASRHGSSARKTSLRPEPSMSEVKSTYAPSEVNLGKL